MAPESPRLRRAARLHQAGRDAAFAYDQTRAVRRLRQALTVLGPPEEDGAAERRLRARILLILAYVAFRFSVSFAPGAVIALVHDVLVTASVWVILGLEFDLNVLAALLES